jgi:hypothetical protein
MKRLLLALCVVLMASTCFADEVNGVLSEDRVVNLPSDQGKWYISVVGDTRDAQYQTIMKWFSQDIPLRKLKAQVHFCPVKSSSAIYKARYVMNVKGLPTVRLQNNHGTVIYEAAGKNLPFTAQGLYGAFAGSVSKVQGIPILPWRRNHKRVPCPSPRPSPQPTPGPDFNLDPEPQPIDGGDAPDFEEAPAQSSLPPLWLMLVTLVVSAGGGLAVEWKNTYAEK